MNPRPLIPQEKPRHLPECRSVPVNQILAERGQEPMEQYASIRIQKCADGCPILERSLEHARTVARERGWLKAGGWVWDNKEETRA